MSKIRPLLNPRFTVNSSDGQNGVRTKQLNVESIHTRIVDSWRRDPRPSSTYNTRHGRERGRRSYDVELAEKEYLVELVQEQVDALARTYNYTGRKSTLVSSHILLYAEGPGCPVHCDDQDPADTDYGLGSVMFNWANQLVALLYLSTEGVDFEGGQLFFPNADLYISAAAGKLVTFPAHYKYKHGVTDIISGKRSLLQTTWRFDL